MFNNSPIPLKEIIQECDRLSHTNQPELLGEHLRFWRRRAADAGDRAAELSLLNELIGHYRMNCDRQRGMSAVEDALHLIAVLHNGSTISGGTILINAATALHSFGFFERATELYERAKNAYMQNLAPDDPRFAGLWNNMASGYSASGEYERAGECYRKALDILKKHNNLMDQAVTYINMAQLCDQINESDPRIEEFLDRAADCFDSPLAVRDGYYAHTCNKCFAAFGLFGRDDYANELKRRAEEFYARA
ncbi:MAG: tetratricopeptide repeat protein [Lentisphaeria bacterium]|nr:tetratricopeptide repeat protein [Lentisphaeria bacterium]